MRFPTQITLNKWVSIATIISFILVPFIIAYVSSQIQSSISNENIKRDYVQMAVQILSKEPKNEEHDDLRQWAVDILSKNSPVAFTAALKKQLKAQPWVAATLDKFPMPELPLSYIYLPPCELMDPPLPLIEPRDRNLDENAKRSDVNAHRLEQLQAWINQRHRPKELSYEGLSELNCYKAPLK